jgi:cell division protein FtsL
MIYALLTTMIIVQTLTLFWLYFTRQDMAALDIALFRVCDRCEFLSLQLEANRTTANRRAVAAAATKKNPKTVAFGVKVS